MGVILSGILGGFSGKVGPVVGARWKSIDYMRSYVVPSNPNTPAQQIQRTKFAAMVALARQIIASVIQPFWSPFYTDKSGFNAFIQSNIGLLDVTNKLVVNSVLSKGTLQPTSTLQITYTPGTGLVQYTWNTDLIGNAQANDYAFLVCYDKTNNLLFTKLSSETRGDGSDTITISTGLSAANVFGWVFFFRGTGSELIVSNSTGDAAA